MGCEGDTKGSANSRRGNSIIPVGASVKTGECDRNEKKLCAPVGAASVVFSCPPPRWRSVMTSQFHQCIEVYLFSRLEPVSNVLDIRIFHRMMDSFHIFFNYPLFQEMQKQETNTPYSLDIDHAVIL